MDLQSLPWYGQLVVFLFIGGIVFGMFYMLHYSENQNTIATLDKRIESVEMEIKRAEKKEGQLKQIQEEIKAKEKVLDDLKEVLPEEKEVSQILRKVQGILNGARLRMQDWKTKAPRRKEVYMEHPYAISVEGNYHNLGLFFDQLSKLKKIFTVNSVKIRPLRKMTSTFSIRVSFTTATYTYKERQKRKKRRR